MPNFCAVAKPWAEKMAQRTGMCVTQAQSLALLAVPPMNKDEPLLNSTTVTWQLGTICI